MHVLFAVAAIIALWLASAPARAAESQRTFATPDEAAAALVSAAKARDRAGILAILGADTAKWISSGDPVADRTMSDQFVATYEARHTIVPAGDTATLTIGRDDFPFAFPLVKVPGGWRFDAAAGREELLARRIGENELNVVNVLRAFVDAEMDYASEDRNTDGVREYAQRFASTRGKKDGLYWPTAASDPPSPLGPLVVQATRDGYSKDKSASSPRPFHGYYFRILKGQGKNAQGGALDYVVKGRMIGGFAAVAYPATYGNSGIMTFIVNHDGKVYERDLGRESAAKARAMTRFDPGPGWNEVKPR
jgi:hypothetical protein